MKMSDKQIINEGERNKEEETVFEKNNTRGDEILFTCCVALRCVSCTSKKHRCSVLACSFGGKP